MNTGVYAGLVPGSAVRAQTHAGELYVSASELAAADKKADADMRAARMGVAACSHLSEAERTQFEQLDTDWNAQHAHNVDIINSTLSLGAGIAKSATEAIDARAKGIIDSVSAVCPSIIAPSGPVGVRWYAALGGAFLFIFVGLLGWFAVRQLRT